MVLSVDCTTIGGIGDGRCRHTSKSINTAPISDRVRLMWMVGVGLLLLMLTFGFTGYLLPWGSGTPDWATQVGTNMVAPCAVGRGRAGAIDDCCAGRGRWEP